MPLLTASFKSLWFTGVAMGALGQVSPLVGIY